MGFDIVYFIHFSDNSFWTYESINKIGKSSQLKPIVLALIVVMAVYSKDIGYVIFALLIMFFLLSW